MPDTTAMLAPEAPPITLTPQDRPRRRGWNTALSITLSLAVLAVVLHELRGFDASALLRLFPLDPLFWITFAAFYFVTPASEWLIFRRLWTIPPGGFVALLRKRVYNELLLGYLGEAYFYTWARRRIALSGAPFGAVKDVAILSAMAGNGVTLLLLAIMLPLTGLGQLGIDSRVLTLSLGVLLLISIGAMALRRQVFSLPRAQILMILRTHLARIAATTALSALLWHLVLPDVPVSWWLFLATLRMLISRLPFVPNKDLLFAGAAVFMLGHENAISALMALMAGLILACHLAIGSALALVDLIHREEHP
ncbi:hypothetical protein [Novosphingobium album (ex Liu et al. 2023)]|uniref:Flippase-like domain-containing protein n=1 Tax=Novosphingobium album (ex Liu et al. 2023) TaxID=3031130 RepID=A0ABT5WPM4_9SPHN|nr:hypothetical protein [Novosphingobium album (ex Liu et al. 2023)]MDE8650893.1 hypothetical protein [Novosphingobium album (ex Liu et al. 2023)]